MPSKIDPKLLDHLEKQGYRITTLTSDSLRDFLKKKGWKRRDRTSQGEHRELWIRPWDGVGYEPLGITLRSAIRRQMRQDGYIFTR